MRLFATTTPPPDSPSAASSAYIDCAKPRAMIASKMKNTADSRLSTLSKG